MGSHAYPDPKEGAERLANAEANKRHKAHQLECVQNFVPVQNFGMEYKPDYVVEVERGTSNGFSTIGTVIRCKLDDPVSLSDDFNFEEKLLKEIWDACKANGIMFNSLDEFEILAGPKALVWMPNTLKLNSDNTVRAHMSTSVLDDEFRMTRKRR